MEASLVAAGGSSSSVFLTEESEAELVPLSSSPTTTPTTTNPILRTGHFLPPRAHSPSLAIPLPPLPLLSELTSLGILPSPSPPKILFKGWRHPQAKWPLWIGKLRPLYKSLWHKAGISLAISSSSQQIHRDPSVFLALLHRWCPATNTFSLPPAEATLSLEDVVVLSGLPALGAPIRSPPPDTPDFHAALARMTAEHKAFRRRSSRKPFHYDWLNYYLHHGSGDHLEHVAFLSLWLSRYVLPSPPYDVVSRHVFPLAIRLAQGTRLALAPAVLASIYRDLRALWEHGVRRSDTPAVVWAPLQLVQMWAWERFVALRPEASPRFVRWDEPRAARWHGLEGRMKLKDAVEAIESMDEFLWRPYALRIDDWCPPSFYKDGCRWSATQLSDDDNEMRTFALCLRPCELVGVDCIEQYLPHRVAMQFGFDQDLPGMVPRAHDSWVTAWETYEKAGNEEIVLFVPPRLHEADVTVEFYLWKQQCELQRSSWLQGGG